MVDIIDLTSLSPSPSPSPSPSISPPPLPVSQAASKALSIYEVLSNIFSLAYHHRPYDIPHVEALVKFCGISKTWKTPAQDLLYSTISIDLTDPDIIEALTQTLDAEQSLCEKITSLQIQGPRRTMLSPHTANTKHWFALLHPRGLTQASE